MIAIVNKTTLLVNGERVGNIPAKKWNVVLVELGASGGYREEDNHWIATPQKRYEGKLINFLKKQIA
jgi:hypothetical protein